MPYVCNVFYVQNIYFLLNSSNFYLSLPKGLWQFVPLRCRFSTPKQNFCSMPPMSWVELQGNIHYSMNHVFSIHNSGRHRGACAINQPEELPFLRPCQSVMSNSFHSFTAWFYYHNRVLHVANKLHFKIWISMLLIIVLHFMEISHAYCVGISPRIFSKFS